MGMKRKQHSAEFKFKVALEAAKEQKTLSQLGSEYELHPTQISEWKRQLLTASGSVFGKEANKPGNEPSKVEIELYEQIGRGALWAQNGTRVTPRVPEKKVARNG